MFSLLEFVLSPVILLMEALLGFYIQITFSVGISVLLLSLTASLAFFPIRKWAEGIETQIRLKTNLVDVELAELKKSLRGEKLFLATEVVYKTHNYHPIQNIGLGASFLVMLPVLISAIFLFEGSSLIAGQSFVFIDDLSEPDQALAGFNMLPLIMSLITVIDGRIRFWNDKKTQYRFYFIALVLLFLVYNMNSALVLYWTTSNISAFALYQWQNRIV